MKALNWVKWLSLFWALFQFVFFIMWLIYLWDKFGTFADFFNPLPGDMGYEAQNAVTWMFVSAFFPDLMFVIIPYWAATLGFWLRTKWALPVLTFATGGWFYGALNNWVCQVSLGAKSFYADLPNEVLISYTIPSLILIMGIASYRELNSSNTD